ncbi:MAG: hypothetical protein E7447_00915 [Ruminococcaceae bacterium]|nr:hypothetical protein [Oscillospiraceae bacterium]
MEQKLFDAAAKLPETALVFEDIDYTPKLSKTRKLPRVFWTVAACLLLTLTIGFGSFAIIAEAQEYQDALAFFAEYGLSTEGLTREEIKAIYRDITAETFENPKTATVITNQTQTIDGLDFGQINGFEIVQEGPTLEQMGALGNPDNGNWEATPKTGIHYAHSITIDEQTQQPHNYVEMYDGELLLWKVLLDGDWRVSGVFPLVDGVLVTGEYCIDNIGINGYQLQEIWHAWFIKLGTTGQVVFSKPFYHYGGEAYRAGNIVQVIGNDDGSLVAFCQEEDGYSFVIRHYSAAGMKTYSSIPFHLNGEIGSVSTWEKGYVVHVNPASKYNAPSVMLLNERGIPMRNITYNTPTEHYFFTDMLVANGKLYISAYTTPKKQVAEPREEIKGILDDLNENNTQNISSTDLTPIVRDNYTAMLLVCNLETGIPEGFYSIDGSLGGKLSCTPQGVLYWDVESITSTFYSPATSSFTIGGTCTVYRYAFIGQKIVQEKTNEITIYRR